jgi:drug/metabolite transporter, DME family
MEMTLGSALPVGRGLWFVCMAATAWGTGGAVAAILYDTSGLGPVAVSWWRFAGGFVLLAAGRRWFGPRLPLRFPRGSWRPVALTGCGLALSQTAYFAAVDMAGLALATIVTIGAGPVLVAVGARFARIEKLDAGRLAAVLVALLGLVLLVGAPAADGSPAAGGRPVGIGVALLSAAAYAAVTLLSRRGTGLPRYDTALGGFGIGAVVFAPLAWTAGVVPTLSGGGLPETLGLLLYLVVVPTALAYALFFAGLAVVRATTASVVALVEPVTAAGLGVGLFGERLTVPALLGGTLLMGTVLLLVRAERRAGARVSRPGPGS